jgi:ankyrin repeat protein
MATSLGVVGLLDDAGAPLGDAGERCEAPLHHAAINGSDEVALLLIGTGAPLGAKDGGTPLSYAVMMCHADVVRILINAGAPLDFYVYVKVDTGVEQLLANAGAPLVPAPR